MSDTSSKLEDIEYYNCDVFEVTDCYVEKHTITSVDCFRYSKQQHVKDIFSNYHDKLTLVNLSLRNVDMDQYQTTISELEAVINNSPTLDKNIVVYRGISCKLQDLFVGKF
jgi:hypothetical protein